MDNESNILVSVSKRTWIVLIVGLWYHIKYVGICISTVHNQLNLCQIRRYSNYIKLNLTNKIANLEYCLTILNWKNSLDGINVNITETSY